MRYCQSQVSANIRTLIPRPSIQHDKALLGSLYQSICRTSPAQNSLRQNKLVACREIGPPHLPDVLHLIPRATNSSNFRLPAQSAPNHESSGDNRTHLPSSPLLPFHLHPKQETTEEERHKKKRREKSDKSAYGE